MVDSKSSNWVIDSGATCHICSDRTEFENLDTNCLDRVTVANGNLVVSTGKGVCVAKLVNSKEEEFNVRVQNVLYIPNFNGNLLSVKKMSDKGLKVLFEGSSCKILTNANKEIGVADQVNNLYKLRIKQPHKIMQVQCNSSCQHYWHKLFGHRDINALKLMQSGKLIDNFKMSDCGVRKVCEICTKSKLTKKPFPKISDSKSSRVLDLIHTDICGPMQTITPSGKRYILTFIDDYSRYTFVYLLKEKSELFEKLKIFVEMVYNKFGSFPKAIRSDNGCEYKSKAMINYLQMKGITSQYTVPYCPQQNGIAERKNRSLVEMSRCMLAEANMNYTYWGEAVNTANYIQNRLISSAIPCTPYERWEGRKANASNLHIFGSKAYVLLPKEKLKKVDDRPELKTFVGYDENSKGLRFLDLITN